MNLQRGLYTLLTRATGGSKLSLGMQFHLKFNLNSSEFVPNSKWCEFERIQFQYSQVVREVVNEIPEFMRIANSREFEPATLAEFAPLKNRDMNMNGGAVQRNIREL